MTQWKWLTLSCPGLWITRYFKGSVMRALAATASHRGPLSNQMENATKDFWVACWSDFLSEHSHPLVEVFENTDWVSYLADVFSILNNVLNLTLQGKDTHSTSMTKWAEMWSCFQQLDTYLFTGDVDRAPMVQIVSSHLAKLNSELNSLFPDIEKKSAQLDWVRNFFFNQMYT